MIQIIVLALIQGLTEFLPVSSSAHLILGSRIFGWSDQGLVFDVATHLGTLFAVLFYFRVELANMLLAWLQPADTAERISKRATGAYLVAASVPVILVGGLAHGWVEAWLRDVRIIAVTTLVFGLLLWLADARSRRTGQLGDFRFSTAMMVGMAQVLALIPGVSRSGITITAARALGFSADAAARFSFLLSIPVIAAAGGYGVLRMFLNQTELDWTQFGLAILFSAVAGWLCITGFLALVKRLGLLPFIIYRLLLGVVLVFWLF